MVSWEPKTVLTWQIAFLLSASLLFSCREATKERLPYYNTPDFNPLFISNANELNTKVRHHIADFSFTDQHNQTITQADVEGKIHVADFFFTSCGSICPVMTDHMKIIDSAYRDDPDVALLSYSVTPWIDRVAVLDSYAKRNQITNKNWHLLTGSKAEIYQLARQSYFAEEDLGFTKDSTNFLHTEHFILIDRNKRIRGIYNGTLELEIRQLVKDIATLKDEE